MVDFFPEVLKFNTDSSVNLAVHKSFLTHSVELSDEKIVA